MSNGGMPVRIRGEEKWQVSVSSLSAGAKRHHVPVAIGEWLVYRETWRCGRGAQLAGG